MGNSLTLAPTVRPALYAPSGAPRGQGAKGDAGAGAADGSLLTTVHRPPTTGLYSCFS